MIRLKNQLCFPLYAASRKVVALYTPLLEPHDLTYLQYIVLMVLWEEDGLKVNQLGKKIFLDSGTLTPLLSKLEQKGFILRKREGRDVRNWLTEKGKALETELADVPCQLANQFPLDKEKAQTLYELLYELLDA